MLFRSWTVKTLNKHVTEVRNMFLKCLGQPEETVAASVDPDDDLSGMDEAVPAKAKKKAAGKAAGKSAAKTKKAKGD